MLETLLRSSRERIPAVLARRDDLEARARDLGRGRGFGAALTVGGLQLIAEIKRRSPSAGTISATLQAAEQARRYAAGGAAAISVLTESEHFGGSLDDLEAVRDAVDLPILRKDFVLDAAQVWESRASGADAILLIVAALEAPQLADLLDVAADAGLDALVEAHTEAEADAALAAGARIVGVNNRDLQTFVTDLQVAERVAPLLGGAGVVKVAESGVSTPDGARRMAAAGYDALLVGEAAVRAEDPALFLRSLAAASR